MGQCLSGLDGQHGLPKQASGEASSSAPTSSQLPKEQPLDPSSACLPASGSKKKEAGEKGSSHPSSLSSTQSSACITITQPAPEQTPHVPAAGNALCESVGAANSHKQPPLVAKASGSCVISGSQESALVHQGKPSAVWDISTKGAPVPPNNAQRTATTKALNLQEMPPCVELDTILKVVCECWEAPSGCITILGSNQVWMCNATSTDGPGDPTCVSWAVAMCPWTLLTPHPVAMAIMDLQHDARFAGNVHHQGGTQSYLTSPLVASNGHRLGAVCIMDRKPRDFAAADCRLMNNFAELTVRELEKHAGVWQLLKGSENSVKPSPVLQAYSRCVRNIDDAADACVMLIDTRVEGWKVLYCGQAWKEWTGVDRVVCQGRTLNELLEFAHDRTDTGVVTKELQRDVINHRCFVTPKLRVRASALPPEMAASSPVRFSFYLSLCPAALDALDSNTLPIGIPSSIPMRGNEDLLSSFYFVRIHAIPDPPHVSRATNCSIDHHHRARQRKPEFAFGPLVAASQLFPSLKARVLLGQGNFASVYLAQWHDVDVALKVIDQQVKSPAEHARAELEAKSTTKLRHPNIVCTFAHAQQVDSVASESGVSNSEGINTKAAGRSSTLGRGLNSDTSNDLFSGQAEELQFLPLWAGSLNTGSRASLEASPLTPMALHQRSRSSCGTRIPSGLCAGTPVSPLSAHHNQQGAMDVQSGGSFGLSFWRAGSTGMNQQQQLSSNESSHAIGNAMGNVLEPQVSLFDCRPAQMETLDEEPASFPSGNMSTPSAQHSVAACARRNSQVAGLISEKGLISNSHESKSMNTTSCAPQKYSSIDFTDHWEFAPRKPESAAAKEIDTRNSSLSPAHTGPLPEYTGPVWHTMPSQLAPVQSQASLESLSLTSKLKLRPAFSLPATPSTDPALADAEGPTAEVESPEGRARLDSAHPTAGPQSTQGEVVKRGSRPRPRRCKTVSFLLTAVNCADQDPSTSPTAGVVLGGACSLGWPPEPCTAIVQHVEQHVEGGSNASASGGQQWGTSVGREDKGGKADHVPVGTQLPFIQFPCELSASSAQASTDATNCSATGSAQMPPIAAMPPLPKQPKPISNPLPGQLPVPASPFSHVPPHSPEEARNTASMLSEGQTAAPGNKHGARRRRSILRQSSGTTPGSEQTYEVGASMSSSKADHKYPLRLRQWLVEEFCDKGTLASAIDSGWLRTSRQLDAPPCLPVVLSCALDIAHGLAHLHTNHVCHGDLTAENVLLQSDCLMDEAAKEALGRTSSGSIAGAQHGFIAKLSDFGLCLLMEEAHQFVVSGSYGAVTHQAPEVIMEQRVGYAADVYSFGVCLWRMLTGSRPWAGLSHLQILVAVGYDGLRLEFPDGMPDELGLQALAVRCMSHNPDERPTSSDLVSELEAMVDLNQSLQAVKSSGGVLGV